MVLFRRLGIMIVLLLIVLPVRAAAKDAPITAPRWMRMLSPHEGRGVAVMLPLPDGTLLVRNGAGVLAVDARGTTRWSMPNIDDAIAYGETVVLRRANVVFAVRDRDGELLWKRPCIKPLYLVVAGDRILTMCDGVSTVLRARDGSVLSRSILRRGTVEATPMIRGARSLNGRYVLVTEFFDGAWMGDSYHVVDAHTGAFLWSDTDFEVVDVTATAIAMTPYPSMMPWGNMGEIRWRKLVDGSLLYLETYDTPIDATDDRHGGRLVLSRAAAYEITMGTTVYRFRRGDMRHAQMLKRGYQVSVVTLGSAAFVVVNQSTTPFEESQNPHGILYLDRPSEHGTFLTRALGRHAGRVGSINPVRSDFVDDHEAIRLGDRVAVPNDDAVRLYDEFGAVELAAKRLCRNPQLAATQDTLFMRCGERGKAAVLAAFSRPRANSHSADVAMARSLFACPGARG